MAFNRIIALLQYLVGPPVYGQNLVSLGSPCFVAVNNLVTATTAPYNPYTLRTGDAADSSDHYLAAVPKCFTHLQIFPIFSDDAVSPGTPSWSTTPKVQVYGFPPYTSSPDPKGLPHTVDSTKWPDFSAIAPNNRGAGAGPVADAQGRESTLAIPLHLAVESPTLGAPEIELPAGFVASWTQTTPSGATRSVYIGEPQLVYLDGCKHILVTKTRAGVATGAGANPLSLLMGRLVS